MPASDSQFGLEAIARALRFVAKALAIPHVSGEDKEELVKQIIKS